MSWAFLPAGSAWGVQLLQHLHQVSKVLFQMLEAFEVNSQLDHRSYKGIKSAF